MQSSVPAPRRHGRIWASACALVLAAPVLAHAQKPPPEPAGQVASPGQPAPVDGVAVDVPAERALGVLPGFLTSNGEPGSRPLSARGKFGLAIRTSFDPSMSLLLRGYSTSNFMSPRSPLIANFFALGSRLPVTCTSSLSQPVIVTSPARTLIDITALLSTGLVSSTGRRRV